MNWLTKLLRSGEPRPPPSWDEWMTEARSPSGYAREAAVQALALSGHGDGARERAAALDTLCALQADDAMALCEMACSDPTVAVRCVANARRLVAAAGNERDSLIILVLRDRSPRVRRLAVALVKKGAAAPSPATLLEMHSADAGAVASFVSVAAHLSPWSRLAFLLNLVERSGADTGLAGRLHRGLARWSSDMIRCFFRPPPDQTRALARLWGVTRDELPTELQRSLASHLQAFGIRDTQ